MTTEIRKMAIAGEDLSNYTSYAAVLDSGDSYEADKTTASGAAGYQASFAGIVVVEAGDAKPVQLGWSGVARAKAGGSVPPGTLLMPTTGGKLIARTAGYCAVARALPRLQGSALRTFADTNDMDVEVFPAPIGYSTTTVSLTYTEIASLAVQTQTATVAGLSTSDKITADFGGVLAAGLVIQDAWVSAANTVSVKVLNITAGALTPNAGAATTTRIGIIKA